MIGVTMETGFGRQFPAKTALSPESAIAADIFDQFVAAQTLKSVLGTFRLLCDTLRLKPTNFTLFYPKLKAKLRSWKAQALWSKFDKRANHKCYNRGRACAHTRVLIIGAGPCGLRTAIEAQLLGAKVVVIEKRDRISRNNVLHLWPFVIHDLRALGAKKFFGKFCAGALDHISIRQLQCILLKAALLLGVEVHENVTFEALREPPLSQSEEKIGWRASVKPEDHPVSQYEFDVLIGADGKRNTLQGFKRKEFRGKLAIAITANFINRHSEAEARVEEISGVAFIFNQKFFQSMREQTGIDLENIVYYKDDTHYFVMTAKKQSLLEKGVIIQDFSDTAKLLAPDNVDREALMEYAREAADFATDCQLPCLEFAVNHYGQADVAMFDFTSMYAAESASKVKERRGYRLLLGLVGDSLLEPFWPTGSGCARGFLSSLDACWMIRSWALGTMTPLQVLSERESVYRLLAQTTPENLNKDYSEVTLNPQSRYPNLNTQSVQPIQVRSLFDSDMMISDEYLDVPIEMPKKKRKRDSIVHPDTLLTWCKKQVALYDNITIENMTTSWKNGLALCAIIHHYRPDLIDFHSLKEDDVATNNQLAFNICEHEFGISPIMAGQEMADCIVPDKLSMVSYINQLYDTFRGEIPHIVRTAVDVSPEEKPSSPIQGRRTPANRLSLLTRLSQCITAKKHRDEPGFHDRFDSKSKKRRSLDKDRALFILNKEQKPILLPSFNKSEKEKVPFSDRVKILEDLLSGEPSAACKTNSGLIYQFSPLELESRFQKSSTPLTKGAKVGRIEKGDWNIKMLEERLKERQAVGKKDSEAVPKWNRDCFEDKLKAMDDKLNKNKLEETERFIDFDKQVRTLDQKLREGSALEQGHRGSNKVSAMAEQLAAILEPKQEHPPLIKSNSRPNIVNARGGSEICHFCSKRVYLMERLSAQGKFFHRGCFKCEYCGTALRLGSYGYAADGNFGGKFLCMQHFGMPLLSPRKRPADLIISGKEKVIGGTPAKLLAADKLNLQPMIAQKIFLDVADSVMDKIRGATPERVEFENSIIDLASEEEILSEIDEDEWTDRNFGTTTTDLDSTDEDESDFSSEEISDDDAFEEVLQRSLTSDETRRLAATWKSRYSKEKKSSSDGVEVEESEDEYDESDDEFSYEAYENDVILEEEMSIKLDDDDDDNEEEEGSLSSDSEQIKKFTMSRSETLEADEAAVVVLESDDENSSDDEDTEVGSDESSSDEYTESAEESDVNPQIVHSIPSIVINEYPQNQTEIDEEVFFRSLEQQQEPLLTDSSISSPIGHEAKTINKFPSSPSYHELDEIPSALLTPVEEIVILGSPELSVTEEEIPLKEITPGDQVLEVSITNITNENVQKDNSSFQIVAATKDEFLEEPCLHSNSLEQTNEEQFSIKGEKNISIADEILHLKENDQNSKESVINLNSPNLEVKSQTDTTPKVDSGENEMSTSTTFILNEEEETDDAMSEIPSCAGSANEINNELEFGTVTLRAKNFRNGSRRTMTKSVIEPLERPKKEEIIESEIQSNNLKDSDPLEQKPLEPASSLPNLSENNIEISEPQDTPTSRKILKLKELYLLGESSNSEQIAKSTEIKSPPTKIEPVLKSVVDMITEKQKMLSPAPSLSIPIHPISSHFMNESSPTDTSFSCSLPNSYKLNEFYLTNALHTPHNIQIAKTDEKNPVDELHDNKELKTTVSSTSQLSDEMKLYGDSIQTTTETIPTGNLVLEDDEKDSLDNQFNLELDKGVESNVNRQSIGNMEIENEEQKICESRSVLDEELRDDLYHVDTSFVTFRNKSKNLDDADASFDSNLNLELDEKRSSCENALNITRSSDASCTENIDDSQTSDSSDLVNKSSDSKLLPATFRYEGRFTQKIGPFSNLRDSLDIRKSSKKNKTLPEKSALAKDSHAVCDSSSLVSNVQPGSLDSCINFPKEKNIANIVHTAIQNKIRTSIHKEIEEIPFADDDNSDNATPQNKHKQFFTPPTSYKINSTNRNDFGTPPNTSVFLSDLQESLSQNSDIFYTPDNHIVVKDLRQIKTVERERARQEARERARLKSDEELGLSPAFYSNIRRKDGREDIINGNKFEESCLKEKRSSFEEQCGVDSQSGSSTESPKTESGHYLETDISVDDAEIQATPLKEKNAVWSGFTLKSKSPKSDTCDTNKRKNKEHHRRSLLSLFSSFAKAESSKSKGKENKKVSSKVSSPDTESSTSEKFPRLKLGGGKDKEKESESRKKHGKSADMNNFFKDMRQRKSENLICQRPKELALDKTVLRHNMAVMMQPSQLRQENDGTNVIAAPRASEDSFSESDEDDPEVDSNCASAKRAKELTEEKLKKLQRIARRVYRQQEQKKLRMAQEIQRQLEELEVKQHELEERGVRVEKALRGEGEEPDRQKEETELMQEWFLLVHEKNVLVRYEQELMVRAKELELEDRHNRLQQALREKMAVDDSQKTQEEIEEEGRILAEMLEIVEQRDALVSMLEEERLRYKVEDEDLESSLLAKGYNLSPPSKT